MGNDQYDLDFNIDNISVDPIDVKCVDDTFTITLPNMDDTISFDSVYTTGTGDYSFDNFYNPGIDITAGDLKIHDEGDIKVGDRSLKEFMDKVEERMNILHVNPELEDQWEELKKLGDEYRQLERELLEKNRMWETLKKS